MFVIALFEELQKPTNEEWWQDGLEGVLVQKHVTKEENESCINELYKEKSMLTMYVDFIFMCAIPFAFTTRLLYCRLIQLFLSHN